MRIGFDAKRAFHNRSGLGNYSRSTIQLLKKYYPLEEYFLFTPSMKNSIDFIEENDFHIITPGSHLEKQFKSYWRTFRLSKSIHKNSINLFHGLSNELPLNITQSKAKSIVTIHDLIFIRYPEYYSLIDRTIYTKKFKYSCEVANKVIAVSQQTKSDIINFLNVDSSKIEVVYQGCNPLFYQQVSSDKKNSIAKKYNLPMQFILFVGSIEERKNALSILKAVFNGKIDIPVVLIGKPTKYVEKLNHFIQKNNLTNQVVFINNVEFDDLPAIYQMSELFVYPSIFEGFGIPILESLNSGVPVITSKGGCFEETGGKSTIYVNPKSTEELMYSMKKVLSDSTLRNKMIDDGYKHALDFREEKIARNLMNLYLEVIKP